MATTTYPLDCGKHQILDLDADEYGNFIALLSNMEVWTNYWRLPLHKQGRYHTIRQLDADRFLIIGEQQIVADNGYIFDSTGQLITQFDAGKYIADVLIQAGQIVISYFDQAAGGPKPGYDGIAVFDFTGQQVFGYNSSGLGFMLDCYCLCKQGKDSVLAYTYPNFPLLELRLTDYQVTKQPTPADFEGARAVIFDRGNVVFYSSYKDKESFFWWNRKDKVKRFGHFSATPLRGLNSGKFLTHDANSFTIVDAMEIMRQENLQH